MLILTSQCRFVDALLQTQKTDQLLQQHLFQQDAFAERFQTKFDQENITSEVLNKRYLPPDAVQHLFDASARRLGLPSNSLLKDIYHCQLQVTLSAPPC